MPRKSRSNDDSSKKDVETHEKLSSSKSQVVELEEVFSSSSDCSSESAHQHSPSTSSSPTSSSPTSSSPKDEGSASKQTDPRNSSRRSAQVLRNTPPSTSSSDVSDTSSSSSSPSDHKKQDISNNSDDEESNISEASSVAIPTLEEATAGSRSGGLNLATLAPSYRAVREEQNHRLSQKARRHERISTIVKAIFLILLATVCIIGVVVPWYVTMRQGISSIDSAVRALTEDVSAGLASELEQRLAFPLLSESLNSDDVDGNIIPLTNTSIFSIWVRRFKDQIARSYEAESLATVWSYGRLCSTGRAAGVRLLGHEGNKNYEFFARFENASDIWDLRLWNTTVEGSTDPATGIPYGYPDANFTVADNQTFPLPLFPTVVNCSSPCENASASNSSSNSTSSASAFSNARSGECEEVTNTTTAVWTGVSAIHDTVSEKVYLKMSAVASCAYSSPPEPDGVFSSDVNLESISQFLISMTGSRNRTVSYVTETDGTLVAVSNEESVVGLDANGDVYRKTALDMVQKEIVCTADFMRKRSKLSGFPFQINTDSASFKVDCQGDTLLFGLRRLTQGGLNWVVTVSVNQGDYTYDLRQDSSIAIGIMLASFLIAVAVVGISFYTLRQYLNSIHKKIEIDILSHEEGTLEGALLKAIYQMKSVMESRGSSGSQTFHVFRRILGFMTSSKSLLYAPDFFNLPSAIDPEMEAWIQETFLRDSAEFIMMPDLQSKQFKEDSEDSILSEDDEDDILDDNDNNSSIIVSSETDSDDLSSSSAIPGRKINSMDGVAEGISLPRNRRKKKRSDSGGGKNIENESGEFVRESGRSGGSKTLPRVQTAGSMVIISLPHKQSALHRMNQHPNPFFDPTGEIDAVLEHVGSWEFDVRQLDVVSRSRRRFALNCLAFLLAEKYRVFDEWKEHRLHMGNFCQFLTELEPTFGDHAFHSHLYACIVLQTMHMLLQCGYQERIASHPIDLVALLLSSLLISAGYPGGDNEFHCSIRTPEAKEFSNRHVCQHTVLRSSFAVLDSLIARDMSPFESWSDRDLTRLRSTVYTLVLSSDPIHHFDLLGQLRARMESERFSLSSLSAILVDAGGLDETIDEEALWVSQEYEGAEEDRLLIMKCMLNLCCIGYALRPVDIMRYWYVRKMDERFTWGEKQLAAGIPVSVFANREAESSKIAKACQLHFNLVVTPLTATLNTLVAIPEVMDNVRENTQTWVDEASKSV